MIKISPDGQLGVHIMFILSLLVSAVQAFGMDYLQQNPLLETMRSCNFPRVDVLSNLLSQYGDYHQAHQGCNGGGCPCRQFAGAQDYWSVANNPVNIRLPGCPQAEQQPLTVPYHAAMALEQWRQEHAPQVTIVTTKRKRKFKKKAKRKLKRTLKKLNRKLKGKKKVELLSDSSSSSSDGEGRVLAIPPPPPAPIGTCPCQGTRRPMMPPVSPDRIISIIRTQLASQQQALQWWNLQQQARMAQIRWMMNAQANLVNQMALASSGSGFSGGGGWGGPSSGLGGSGLSGGTGGWGGSGLSGGIGGWGGSGLGSGNGFGGSGFGDEPSRRPPFQPRHHRQRERRREPNFEERRQQALDRQRALRREQERTTRRQRQQQLEERALQSRTPARQRPFTPSQASELQQRLQQDYERNQRPCNRGRPRAASAPEGLHTRLTNFFRLRGSRDTGRRRTQAPVIRSRESMDTAFPYFPSDQQSIFNRRRRQPPTRRRERPCDRPYRSPIYVAPSPPAPQQPQPDSAWPLQPAPVVNVQRPVITPVAPPVRVERPVPPPPRRDGGGAWVIEPAY